MTATTIASPARAVPADAPVTVPETGTTTRRRAAGIAMIGAGVISMAGFLATPWEGSSGEASYLRALANHPKQAIVAAVLLHFGYLLFVPAAFTMARLARRGSRKLSAAGIVLSVLGVGLSGLLVTDAYDLSIARHVGTTAGVPVSNFDSVPLHNFAMISMGLTVSLGSVIGMVVLAIAMRRARLAPLWPAFAILGGFVVVFGAHDMLRACTAFGVVAAGIAYLGVKVLRMSDQRFAYGSDPR